METLEEVEELVVLGGRNRTVGNNNVNEHSSRSHLVLQVQIASTDLTTGYVQHGKLNLIDLAGSERIKARYAWILFFTFCRLLVRNQKPTPGTNNVRPRTTNARRVVRTLGSLFGAHEENWIN